MTNSKNYIVFILLALLLFFYKSSNAAIEASRSRIKTLYIKNYTMGTTYSCQAIYPDMHGQKLLPTKIGDESFLSLRNVNQNMSTYITGACISRLNKSKAHSFLTASSMAFVIHRSLSSTYSMFFCININRLVNIWKFTNNAKLVCTPKLNAICNTIISVSYDTTVQEKKTVLMKYLNYSNITLSGSAKGYGVDLLSRIMHSSGLKNFLCEIGGEIRSSGLNECMNT